MPARTPQGKSVARTNRNKEISSKLRLEILEDRMAPGRMLNVADNGDYLSGLSLLGISLLSPNPQSQRDSVGRGIVERNVPSQDHVSPLSSSGNNLRGTDIASTIQGRSSTAIMQPIASVDSDSLLDTIANLFRETSAPLAPQANAQAASNESSYVTPFSSGALPPEPIFSDSPTSSIKATWLEDNKSTIPPDAALTNSQNGFNGSSTVVQPPSDANPNVNSLTNTTSIATTSYDSLPRMPQSSSTGISLDDLGSFHNPNPLNTTQNAPDGIHVLSHVHGKTTIASQSSESPVLFDPPSGLPSFAHYSLNGYYEAFQDFGNQGFYVDFQTPGTPVTSSIYKAYLYWGMLELPEDEDFNPTGGEFTSYQIWHAAGGAYVDLPSFTKLGSVTLGDKLHHYYRADITNVLTYHSYYDNDFALLPIDDDNNDFYLDHKEVFDGATVVYVFQDSTASRQDIYINNGPINVGSELTTTIGDLPALDCFDAKTTFVLGSKDYTNSSYGDFGYSVEAGYGENAFVGSVRSWATYTDTSLSRLLAVGDTSADFTVEKEDDPLIWTAQIFSIGDAKPPDQEPKDKCGCDAPPDLLGSNVGTLASPSNESAGGVRTSDGTVVVGSNNLSSNAFGTPWGQSSAWSNQQGYTCNTTDGNGWRSSQFPSMEQINGNDSLALIDNNGKSRYFDLSDDIYVERNHGTDTLTIDPETGRYTIEDALGNQLLIESYNESVPESRRGKMIRFQDAFGNQTQVVDWTADDLPQEVVRSTPEAVTTNLLENPGFETPTFSGHFTASVTNSTSGYSSANFGWTVSSGNIDHIHTYWSPNSGDYSIELNGDTPGAIEQTVTTVPGETYAISFYYSDNIDLSSGDVAHATVSVLDDTEEIDSWEISHSSSTASYLMDYTHFYQTFVATGTTTTLRLTGHNSDAGYGGWARGMVIDDASLQLIVSPVVESYLYSYTTLSDDRVMMDSVVQRRKIDDGDWEIIRKVENSYYDSGSDPNGNVGDLKTTKTLDADDNVLTERYYRYYKQGDANGYRGGMKLSFSPESFARASADLSDPFTATDAQLAPYADIYLEYDLDGRVTLQRVQGEGCTACSEGIGEYHYEYSSYPSYHFGHGTTVTLPDGNKEIFLTNFQGQVTLHHRVQMEDDSPVRLWSDIYGYDNQGRLTQHIYPSALGDDTEFENTIFDYQGLIETYYYYTSTTATTSTAGGVEGLLESTYIQPGELGTPVIQSSHTYILNDNGKDFPASVTNYSNDDGTGAITTSYSYTWFSGTDQVQSLTTTLPTIASTQNGPNTTDTETVVYNRYGFPVWTKDARGFIQYNAFDIATGSLVKHIDDVNTTNTTDFVNLPSGWSTPSGGGLHLVTTNELDLLGRVTKTTDPAGTVTYLTYDDINKEMRVYTGWDETNSVATGPTLVTRNDWAHRYSEILTMSAEPDVDDGRPTGTESISNIQSLTRSYLNNAAQTIGLSEYFNLSGLTYTTSATLGTQSTTGTDGNYLLTSYSYDHRGRLAKTVSPAGTINRTVFDLFGAPTSTWVGTNDTPSSGYWSPDNPADMVKTTEMFYEQDHAEKAGNHHLTSVIEYPGNGADPRLTQMTYDWRDRLVETKSGILETEDTDTHRLISYLHYDNLNRILSAETYAGDMVPLYGYDSERDYLTIIDEDTDSVPDTPDESLLRAKTVTSFDNRNQVYQTQVYAVDPTDGTVGYALSTNTWHDKRGNVIKTSAPGGLVQKFVYDGVGRVVASYTTDGGGDSSWSDANSVSGDVVLSQTETTYDANSNPIFTISRDRFHDETGTGALDTPTSGVHARVSYSGAYYDLADRLIATVDVGTNGGSAYSLPSPIPSSSNTRLVTTYSYDDAGRVEDVVDPIGVVTRTTYDAMGRVATTVRDYTDGTPTDSSNFTTAYTYHTSGNINTITAVLPDDAEQTTQYIYGVTHQPSGGTGSAVSSNDLLYQVKYPSGSTGLPTTPAEQYSYNALGQTIQFTDRNGTIHDYHYVLLGRQVSDIATSLGSGVDNQVRRQETAFDSAGNAYLFTSYNATTSGSITSQISRAFNGLGQLTEEYQQHGAAVNTSTSPVVQYSYSTLTSTNNLSRLTRMTYPNGRSVTYSYSSGLDTNISRVSAISDSGGTLESYSYLGLNTIVKRTRQENRTEMTLVKLSGESNGDAGDQYTGLDRFGRIVDQRWTYTNTATPAVTSDTDRFFYGYGRDGRVLYRENAVNSAFSELYGYDASGQLTSFKRGTLNSTKDGITGTPARTQDWSLDATGNWESLTTNSTTVNRTHDLQNRTTTVGSNSLAFDNNGNMLTDEGGNTYKYDAWNRLVQVKDSSNNVLSSYGYDAAGRRIQEASGGVTRDLYYSSGWQVLEERMSGVTKNQYVWGLGYIDALVLRDRDADANSGNGLEERLYAQQDANWNVTSLMDGTGSTSAPVLQRNIFDPYGQTSVLTSTWTTGSQGTYGFQYLFQGGRFDAATGLYHFRNRDLSPSLGRWISQDPIQYQSNDMNLYRGYSNSPTTSIDPLGLDDFWLWNRPWGIFSDFGTVMFGPNNSKPNLATFGTSGINNTTNMGLLMHGVRQKDSPDAGILEGTNPYRNYLTEARSTIDQMKWLAEQAVMHSATGAFSATCKSTKAFQSIGSYSKNDGWSQLSHRSKWNYVPPPSSLQGANWQNEGMTLLKRFNGKVEFVPTAPKLGGNRIYGGYNPTTNQISIYQGGDDTTLFEEL